MLFSEVKTNICMPFEAIGCVPNLGIYRQDLGCFELLMLDKNGEGRLCGQRWIEERRME